MRAFAALTGGALAALAIFPASAGAISFSGPTNFGAGSAPQSIAAGDFNDDGARDLAVANFASHDVSVLLGTGTGSFGGATNFGAGTRPYSVAVGDFNHDGAQDLAVANSGSNDVSILLGTGTGSFGAATNFGAGLTPTSVAVGDFDNNGAQDLAVGHQFGSSNVSVLLGTGTGSFGAATNFAAGTDPTSVAVGDFDNNGVQDLAVANQGSNNVSILLGTGTGSFGAPTNFGAGTSPNSVAVGDFNRDGTPDLAVANFASHNVSVLLGTGTGSFGAATNFGAGTNPYSVTVGDFDHDGAPDLAVPNITSNDVSILLGTGTGSFGAATNFGAGTTPDWVAVGDFNRDGAEDLAVANSGSNNVSILLNQTPSMATGDFVAPGTSPEATGSNPRSVAVGDFNNDGKQDLVTADFGGSTDVGILLGDGTGNFSSAGSESAFLGPISVAVGDFNRDGDQDLAVAKQASNVVAILIGDGTGNFTELGSGEATGSSPFGVSVGDFNRDGKQDLAVANFGVNNVTILLGDGTGDFNSAGNKAAGTGPASVTVGDFNANGKQDLAVVNYSSDDVTILLGDGTGDFTAPVSSPEGTGDQPYLAAVGDFNADGKQDLAVTNELSDNVTVMLGNGAGDFTPAGTSPEPVGDGPISVAVGDFDADGKQDLAVANRASNNASILLGSATGNFTAAGTSPETTGSDPFSVVVGDFDRNGGQDLAVANQVSNNVTILLEMAQPSIATMATANATVGQSISDQATLSGGTSPGGTITFRAYGPNDANCTGTAAYTSNAVAVSGNGAYNNSPTFTPSTVGTYRWRASYSGDSNNAAVSGACNAANESSVVAQATPAISTQATANATVGAAISDTATLSGGSSPTGTITFRAYAPSDVNCTGTGLAYISNTVAVNGNGNYSNSPTFNSAGAGTYRWTAAYSGDTNNAAVSTACNDANESSVIAKATPTISTSATANATIGGSISDQATLAGAYGPGGTITFTAYGPNNTDCSGAAAYTSSAVTVTANGNYSNSPTFTPTTAGTYRWRASYSGDTNNAAVSSACNAANESSVIAQATPTISTSATATATIGGSISDQATLAGAYGPGGTITFTAYGPNNTDCSGAAAYTSSAVTVTANGNYSNSPTFTPTTAGTYRWRASYSGDTNNAAVSTACNAANESSVIAQATPTISTSATATATIGGSISDQATLAGAYGPGGTITFTAYGPNNTDCSGAAAYTSSAVTVTANGNYSNSPTFTPTTAGTYRWRASYSGDTNNAAVSSACNAANESSAVAQATPTISTSATATATIGGSISDQATLAGAYGPGGTITFTAYGPNNTDCSGAAAYTSSAVTVTANGNYSNSPTFTPTTAGTYRWRASYSGDTNNAAVSSACNAANESSVIAQATPTISTSATATATIGGSISDQATLAGAYGPGGTITFTAYGPNNTDCSGAAAYTSSAVTVTANGNYSNSPTFTPTTAGTYRWRASYSGDTNNAAVSTACNAANESSVIAQATPTISTSATATATIGGSISDQATLAGAYGPGGTITFTAYGPNNTDCSGAAAYTSSAVTVTANGNYNNSPTFTPTTAGTYRWRASYSGDTNNAAVSTACNAANESSAVAQATPTISTSATANATIGGQISDQATLAGGYSPTGTITFTAYGPNDTDCSNTAAFTDTETVSVNGNYTTNPAFTPVIPGTYRWIASYSGDTNNNTVATACDDANESSAVGVVVPTLSTQATANATVGDQISDQATLSGGTSPTGTITFRVYGPDDTNCTGSIAFTDTETVSGNDTYTTNPAFTPSTIGTYRWRASYSGDTINAGVTGACNDANESSVVAQATPTISTLATANVTIGGSISDQATLASGFSATGMITFDVYGPNDTNCTGSVAFTDTEAVSGNGTYTTNPTFTPSTVGTYRWRASYSGDTNNAAVSGACNTANESSTVSQATPTISTVATPSATLGQSISDQANLSGGYTPEGVIVFVAYGPNDPTCSVTAYGSSLIAVSGNGNYNASPAFTPSSAGTYRWRATYSGDTNNAAVSGPCDAANESSVVMQAAALPASEGALCRGQAPTIVGTARDDVLQGTPGPDIFQSWLGDDTILGMGGDDLICGGEGDDVLRGGAGDDRIFGREGDDLLLGRAGDDLLSGGPGGDRLGGGTGDDLCSGGGGPDVALASCESTKRRG